MKYISVILILIVQNIAFSQPLIQIEGNGVYDWGKIDSKGKPLTAKVKIFNKGNDTLKIKEVKPGCGCTTAPLDKKSIEPNGFATITISLKVSNDGPVQKSINITSNDPKSPTKNLKLKAEIVRPLSLSEKFLSFDDLQINKEAVSKVTIKNNTNKSIKFKNIVTEPKELKINLKQNYILPAEKEFNLEVKYTPKTESNLSGKVKLKTDNKEMEFLEIFVWGSVTK